MSLTQAVTVQHPSSHAPRIERISRRVKVAIDLMVMEGLSRPEAAQKAGITDNNLYQQLRKPAVLAYRATAMEVIRTSAASRTIARAEKLADGAESEHVRLQANTWIAAIDGVSPITKSESTIQHKGLVPGLTVNYVTMQAPGDDARVIDGQARQVELPQHIKDLPQPIPHPSMRNALPSDHPGHELYPPGAGGVGAKT